MENEQEFDMEEGCRFDTVFRGKEIDNITITGHLKHPSMITVFLVNGDTVSFEPVMDNWRRGLTAAIEGHFGTHTHLKDDGQTVESAAEKEKDAD